MSSWTTREKKLAPFFDEQNRARHNKHRPKFCATCPIGHCTLGYVPPEVGTGEELVVSEMPNEDERYEKRPFVGGIGTIFNNLLKIAGYARKPLSIIHTLGCQPPLNRHPLDNEWSFTGRQEARDAVWYCQQQHLWPFVNSKKWKRILALGNRSLTALTTRSGITIWAAHP